MDPLFILCGTIRRRQEGIRAVRLRLPLLERATFRA